MSGTFASATGDAFSSFNSPANFYDNINSTNAQGLTGDDYTESLNLLANTDEFKYNLIVAPGLTRQNNSAPLTTMVDNAQSRGDNLAVIDLRDFGSTLGATTTAASAVDSSYAATYWPWVQTLDPDTGEQCWVPASTMIPGVYAFNDNSSEAWFAPAGLNRGGLSTVLRAERKLTNGNRDTLYTNNVNPIATFPNAGVVVFGQKTLQKKASALDRVNVRRLLIELKSYISQVADTLVFQQNTMATRNDFLSQVNPYLESVQQRQGLYAFKVVMDDSNNTPDVIDRNQMVGQIYLQPTKTAEFIYLDFNILPTGATFPA
jgi:phage tail sheath protein FI